jgi:hypothetical protein
VLGKYIGIMAACQNNGTRRSCPVLGNSKIKEIPQQILKKQQ